MAGEGRWVRVATALSADYEPESSLQADLRNTDDSNVGKLLRALVRAGFKASRNATSTATSPPAAQSGGDSDS